jgi:hemerythrin-like domain-containing protein
MLWSMALVTVRGTRGEDTLVGALADCHERIRRFSQLAVKLESEAAPVEQRVEAAQQLVRYFSEALPRHVADEEESLRPRLPAIESTLAQMAREHDEHQPFLERLLARWRAVAAGERRADASAAADARALVDAFEQHLALEEKVVFPAVAQLPSETQSAIRAEMRARRG